MNQIKNNWFRVSILIVLLILCAVIYKFYRLNAQSNLSQNQEKCRVAGAKIDSQNSSVLYPTQTSWGYSYNNELNTCLEYYSYDSSPNPNDRNPTDNYWATGDGIKDIYNDDTILDCDANFSHKYDGGNGDMTVIENKNGINYENYDNNPVYVIFKKSDQNQTKDFTDMCSKLSTALGFKQY